MSPSSTPADALIDLLTHAQRHPGRVRDLYLEEEWLRDADGWFDRPVDNSWGLWIHGDQVGAIEFYEGRRPE